MEQSRWPLPKVSVIKQIKHTKTQQTLSHNQWSISEQWHLSVQKILFKENFPVDYSSLSKLVLEKVWSLDFYMEWLKSSCSPFLVWSFSLELCSWEIITYKSKMFSLPSTPFYSQEWLQATILISCPISRQLRFQPLISSKSLIVKTKTKNKLHKTLNYLKFPSKAILYSKMLALSMNREIMKYSKI